MPTYQYACTECGYDFETVQSFTDPSLTDCPRCSGRLRKVFNAVGIVFKGSGFYRTDSRSSSNGDSAPKKDTSDKPTSDGSPSTTTSTPAASSSGSSSTTASTSASTAGSAA